jgi:CheY-like chemotaxis protein
MVVEDETDLHDVMLGMFEVWGVGGISFDDGLKAMKWVDDIDKGKYSKYKGELPELAILDIRLPTASGIEVSERIRHSKRLAEIAIVLITAYRLSPDEEERTMTMAQADALIYKPMPGIRELRKVLEEIVAEKEL